MDVCGSWQDCTTAAATTPCQTSCSTFSYVPNIYMGTPMPMCLTQSLCFLPHPQLTGGCGVVQWDICLGIFSMAACSTFSVCPPFTWAPPMGSRIVITSKHDGSPSVSMLDIRVKKVSSHLILNVCLEVLFRNPCSVNTVCRRRTIFLGDYDFVNLYIIFEGKLRNEALKWDQDKHRSASCIAALMWHSLGFTGRGNKSPSLDLYICIFQRTSSILGINTNGVFAYSFSSAVVRGGGS